MRELESFLVTVDPDDFSAIATCAFRDGTTFRLHIGRHTLRLWAPDFDHHKIEAAIVQRRDRLVRLAIAAQSIGRKKLRL